MSGALDLRVGDCMAVFEAEQDASFDAFCCDPPSGINFMSRSWDRDHGGRDHWIRFWSDRFALMRRKAKPGAWSLTWALPRTAHWTAMALDDAGWRIVDCVHHVQGQGWPKNRALLKPAHEHWILASNGPAEELQIDAARVRRDWTERGEAWLRSGHSAKPEAAKIGGAPPGNGINANPLGSWPTNQVLSHDARCSQRGTRKVRGGSNDSVSKARQGTIYGAHVDRRGHDFVSDDGTETTPAYDCLAGCLACGASTLAPAGGTAPRCGCGEPMVWACPVAEVDAQSGFDRCRPGRPRSARAGAGWGQTKTGAEYTDEGGASRFFPCLPGDLLRYQAKTNSAERDAGCEALFWRVNRANPFGFDAIDRATWEALPEDERGQGNVHPTVKPLGFLEWALSLLTPPGGRVGDLTVGSGGTAIAIERLNVSRGLGAKFLGADICPEAILIAEARLAWWRAVRLDTKPRRAPGKGASETPPQPSLFDRTGGPAVKPSS